MTVVASTGDALAQAGVDPAGYLTVTSRVQPLTVLAA
jgi:hypothetical protein